MLRRLSLSRNSLPHLQTLESDYAIPSDQRYPILYDEVLRTHRNIKNTLIYIQLEEAIFKEKDDEFICKVAKTVDEAKALIEEGFEYACEFEDVKLFRKRK